MDDKNVSWYGEGFVLSYELKESNAPAMTREEMEQGIRFQCMKMAVSINVADQVNSIDVYSHAERMYNFIMTGESIVGKKK